MALIDISKHINELNDNTQAYINSKFEYYKLQYFKKLTKGSSKFIKLLIFGSIFLFCLGFISTGFSILIGNAIGNLAYGFFIMGGIYIVVLILFMVFGQNYIDKIMLKEYSKMFFNQNKIRSVVDEPLKNKIED